jgi:hypothetical protein
VDHAVRCHPGRSSGGWVNVLITDVDTGSGWPRSRPARTALVAPRAVRRQPPRSPRRRRQPHLRRSAAGGHRLQPRGVRAVDRSERTRARRSRSRPRRRRPGGSGTRVTSTNARPSSKPSSSTYVCATWTVGRSPRFVARRCSRTVPSTTSPLVSSPCVCA